MRSSSETMRPRTPQPTLFASPWRRGSPEICLRPVKHGVRGKAEERTAGSVTATCSSCIFAPVVEARSAGVQLATGSSLGFRELSRRTSCSRECMRAAQKVDRRQQDVGGRAAKHRYERSRSNTASHRGRLLSASPREDFHSGSTVCSAASVTDFRLSAMVDFRRRSSGVGRGEEHSRVKSQT